MPAIEVRGLLAQGDLKSLVAAAAEPAARVVVDQPLRAAELLVAGVFGFCVASVTRNTGVAIGIVLGYLIASYVFNVTMNIVEDLQSS